MSGLLEEARRAPRVAGPLVVHREFGSDFVCAVAIQFLAASPDAAVEVHAA